MSTINLRRGLANTGLQAQAYAATTGTLEWSNGIFTGATPVGTTPLALLLRLLTSTGTSGANGTNDVYRAGIGLGIPQDQIDLTTFDAITSAVDWDTNGQLFFRITKPEPAKQFIEEEICRPFGLYLVTGNDGKIRCVRSRHPQLFYIGDSNRRLTVRPTSTAQYTGLLDIGVFTADQMCEKVDAALSTFNLNGNGKCHHFTCSWDAVAHKFSLSMMTQNWVGDTCGSIVSDAFDIVVTGDPKGWNTLGWTANVNDVQSETPTTAPEAVGTFTTTNALSKDDMWAVRMVDNQEDRITSVVYSFDYDLKKDSYQTTRVYSDPEYVALEDSFGPHEYFIQARGLVSGGPNSKGWPAFFMEPEGGSCAPQRKRPDLAVGVNADTWAKLHALALIDRYRQPPIKFRAKLKWKWNGLEVGDLVRVSYDIRGVLIDHELNKDTLDNRIFEIVELHPNFDGSLDATFLGHRYVSY